MTFTFIYLHFQIHFSTNSLSHFLYHLNIISSFIIYYFFNNYTSSNIFIQHLIIIIEKKDLKNEHDELLFISKKKIEV